MLCMNCKKNKATFYYNQNINGNVSETALCSECAGKLGYNVIPDTFSFNPFGSLFGMSTPQIRRAPGTSKRCTLCGSVYGDLVKSGKVGCAKCYEIFSDELSATITKLHGHSTHAGRAPREYRAKNERLNKEKRLRAELKKAVDAQDYERAAVLRDELKKFEDGK